LTTACDHAQGGTAAGVEGLERTRGHEEHYLVSSADHGRRRTGCADELTAIARLSLNVVNVTSFRHGTERDDVPRAEVRGRHVIGDVLTHHHALRGDHQYVLTGEIDLGQGSAATWGVNEVDYLASAGIDVGIPNVADLPVARVAVDRAALSTSLLSELFSHIIASEHSYPHPDILG